MNVYFQLPFGLPQTPIVIGVVIGLTVVVTGVVYIAQHRDSPHIRFKGNVEFEVGRKRRKKRR